MATGTSVIIRALQMIGAKEIGATLAAGEETSYLAVLNSMLDSWSIQRLLVYQILQENFSLSASVGTYTIGSGGTFNTTRPTKIVYAFIRDTDNIDYDLTIIPTDSYNAIRDKTVDGSYPHVLYYDMAFVNGLGTIKIYPEPKLGLTLYIDSWRQLGSIPTVATTLSFPPGYELMITSNLAIHLSAGFRPVQAEVAKIARDSMAAVKGLNAPESILQLDLGISVRSNSSRNNIYTG